MNKNLKATVFCLSMFVIPGAYATEEGSMDHLLQQWSQTMKSLKSFTAEQRDEAVKRTGKAIETLDKEIETMEHKTQENWHKLSADARENRRAALRELRQHRNSLAEWYGTMKSSTGESWANGKSAFISKFNETAKSIQDGIESLKMNQN